MIKTNIFSGHTYVTTGNVKTSDTGETFTRCGNSWFSQDGDVIQKQGNDWVNLKTGVRSSFGDPFGDDDD
jgi:hypothetical protein